MTRVVSFDGGMNLGYAAIGGGDVVSGSFVLKGGPRDMGVTMRHADQAIRSVIIKERPDVIAFACPFVGQVSVPIFYKGKPTGKMKFQPINPDSIRPLFGILAKVEEIAAELHIRCVELSEGECRSAFLDGKIPKGTKAIKIAVMEACRKRGWPVSTDHAGDALCVASRALEIVEPEVSHEVTPLFTTAPKANKARKKP